MKTKQVVSNYQRAFSESPKDSTTIKIVRTDKNSVKLQDIKSTYKNLAFLYINNEQSEKSNKKTIVFTIATKIIRYLELTEDVK